MGQFSLSSNPLSTLFPSFSSLKDPDYSNVFLMDLGNLKTNTSPTPDYAKSFLLNTLPIIDSMKFKTGLATMNSSDPSIAFKGRALIDNSTLGSSSIFPTGDTTKVSLSDRFANSTFGKNYGLWNAGLNLANTAFTGIFGEKDEYQGEKGDITQSMDSTYDTILSAAGAFGPIGKLVSLGMGANKLLGNVANKLGGGTDGMTTTDAILGSSFLQLTPFGLINGFGGSEASTITKNDQVFETIGSSYTGTNLTVNDALTMSGKKYGLFSSKARKNANLEIEEARRLLDVMEDISDEAMDRFAIRNSMAAINGNRRNYKMLGGYDYSNIRVGKNGMNIQVLERAKSITLLMKKFLLGGTVPDPFEEYLLSLPESLRDSTNFRVRDYWEYNGRPKNFEEAKEKGMFKLEEDFDNNGNSLGYSWHAFTVAKNPNADEYDFMKSPSHPTLLKELDWYNSNDPEAIAFRREYELQKVLPYYKYVKRRAPYKDTPLHKNGGSIIEVTPVPTEILLIDPNEIPEFQNGGTISLDVRDYYKDYDLNDVVIMLGEPRTESDTIYANNNEDQVHELWHWISLNRPNENLKYFYDDLNDLRILELGGDLDFVKRTGDPGNFYHPSEIEARLKAAKFMSQGLSYTKDFFSNLRKDENKYGYNMRDLLHMYNDENLEKLFNTSLQSFKEGGSINVIPEGALHARKHNMDMEGITKKGIPVVAEKEDGEIEQLAEIEKEEIIFRLEVTKKLEELEKKYYNPDTSLKEKDALSLEAGKLLVLEILYNTIDNVNLIDKV